MAKMQWCVTVKSVKEKIPEQQKLWKYIQQTRCLWFVLKDLTMAIKIAPRLNCSHT